MKHVNANGTSFKGRRYKSNPQGIDTDAAKDPEAIAKAVNKATERLVAIEATVTTDVTEFEFTAPSLGTIRLNHGFNGPVRWYVTSWKRKGTAGVCSLTEVESGGSDANTLVLYSLSPGRAVVRVERQQAGILRDDTTRTAVPLNSLGGAPGSPGDAIVNVAGALGGVSPSTSGNLLTSNGSAWASTTPVVPGNNHDVIVKLSGALTGVAPSTTGKVLMSDGTDWLAAAVGSNHGVITNASGSLTSVAPSTSGNILTSNGTDWVSSAPATQPIGVWTSIYDIDFTSLGLTTASGNGNFTIDGFTWTIQSFAKSAVMSVGGSDGLRIKCSAAASNMAIASIGAASQAPTFMSPALTTLLPSLPDEVRVGLRFSFYVKSFVRGSTNDATYFIISDSTINGTRFEMEQYNLSGVQTEYMRMVLTASSPTVTSPVQQSIGSSLVTAGSTHDCMQWEMNQLGIDIPNIIHSGVYSSGWPTKWYRRAQCSAAAGSFYNTSIRELADARVLICQGAVNTNGTSECKIGRMKIEYYRYQ